MRYLPNPALKEHYRYVIGIGMADSENTHAFELLIALAIF